VGRYTKLKAMPDKGYIYYTAHDVYVTIINYYYYYYYYYAYILQMVKIIFQGQD
jgi:hypothetical protein